MSLRERIQQKPALLISTAVATLLIASAIGFYTLRKNPNHLASGQAKAFFTTDDGVTFFQDSASKTPPFDHQGKPAVAAMVFEANGKQFINHLERYTPEAIKAIHDYEAKVAIAKTDPGPGPWGWINLTGKEIKRPTDKTWTRIDNPNAHLILEVKLPNGLQGQPTQIFP